MNDDEFQGLWSSIEPTTRQRRTIDGRVFEWVEAHETSLAAEWLALFRVKPFPAFSLVAVSAVPIALSIVTAPPLVWLARVLL